MVTKDNWTRWREEVKSFNARQPHGFTQDLEALKNHIAKLQEVSPKDKAGWPEGEASFIIYDLHKEYERFAFYLAQTR